MFGFTLAFLMFSVVLIWAAMLEPRSKLPNAVNGVYWTTTGIFGVALAAGAAARMMVEEGSPEVATIMVEAPHIAQIAVLGALIALTGLTVHRLVTGPPEYEEDAPDEGPEAQA